MTTKTETNWLAKEKRELFCKFVNTKIMANNPLTRLSEIHQGAQETVDKAFELYPDETGKEETKPF